MFKQSHSWHYPTVGPMFQILGKFTPWAPTGSFAIMLFNGTHRWVKGQGVICDHWHHIAFVYTEQDGFMLFFDGYRNDAITPGGHNRGTRNLELGCQGTSYCTKAKYDDLRVWNEAKSENFIWRIWQS